jgi:hypothetical protein
VQHSRSSGRRGTTALAAVTVTLSMLAPFASAADAPPSLPWVEVAPVCNRISTAGVGDCGSVSYPAVFTLGVGTLVVRANSWSVAFTITNLTDHTLTIAAAPIRLCVFTSASSTQSRCLDASQTPAKPMRLPPVKTWEAHATGRGRIAAGEWVRVLLPAVTGSFGSPTGGIVAWMTLHAWKVGTGTTVMRGIGSGP